jgi:WD40 repeat protein
MTEWHEPTVAEEQLKLLWQQGQRPDVWQFLAPLGNLPPDALVGLLAVDQQQRWHGGERVPAEVYLERCPALANDVELALELVYGEFLLRRRLGEAPVPDDYARRFPPYAARLRQQLELCAALERGTSLTWSGGTISAFGEDGPEQRVLRGARADLPRLHGCEVLHELGRGAMGVVYLAWRQNLRRLEAVKMLLPGQSAGPAAVARFRTEGEAAARLHHPNIVAIYEVGESDGRPYLAMEYVDGGTLARGGGTPRPSQQAARLVKTLAWATHYAHGKGVVHRDLKPANVLLAVDGTPRIADFGLAKLLVGGHQVTQTGAVLGTPSYMAPEQADGRNKEVGALADVYALGVILYELLTGRPPFKADTQLETLRQVVHCEPVGVRRLQPAVPRDLEVICLKCLEKEPAGRYASAADLAEDLECFLAGEPIRARPVHALARLERWCRRRPTVAGLAASVLLLFVVLAAGSLAAALVYRDQLGRMAEAERERTCQLNRTAEAERERTRQLAAAELERVRSGRLTRQQGQGFGGRETIARVLALLGPDRTPAHMLELRNELIACLATPDLCPVDAPQSTGLQSDRGGYAFDPHLERYCYLDRSRRLFLRQLSDNRILLEAPPPPPGNYSHAHAAFSPDGRFLAVNYWGPNPVRHLVVRDAGTGKVLIPRLEVRGQVGFDFQPDSQALAAVRPDGTIRLYALPGGTEVRCLADGINKDREPRLRFAPGGDRLACATNPAHVPCGVPATVDVLATDTGQRLLRFEPRHLPPDTVEGIDWSRDGRLLALGCADHHIYVYDTETVRLQSVLEGHQSGVIGVAFSPAGDLLASTSWDHTTRLWDPISGREWMRVPGGYMAGMRFAPDGRRLATAARSQFRLWEVANGAVCRTFHVGAVGNRTPWRKGDHIPRSVALTRDGRLLATADDDGVRLWDVAAGRERGHLDRRHAAAVLFEPDGGALLAYGSAGLLRWPLRPDANAPAGVQPGEAEFLFGPGNEAFFPCLAQDAAGARLAFTDVRNCRAVLLERGGPRRQVDLRNQGRLTNIALSPDSSRTATTTSYQSPDVQVWEPATGHRVTTLRGEPTDDAWGLTFSPDGRWLVVGSSWAYTAWRTDAWTKGWRVAKSPNALRFGPAAFSGDGRLLALSWTSYAVQLVDPDTGQELATLTAPEPHVITGLSFDAAGDVLAAVTQDHLVQVWDLRTLRRELAAQGLAWPEWEP